MDLFNDDELTPGLDRVIYHLIDFSGWAHNALKLQSELLRRQAAEIEDVERQLQLHLRTLVQAVTDLRTEDHEPERDQLGSDHHGQRA